MLSAIFAKAQNKTFKLDSLKHKFIKDSTWIFRPRKVFPLVALDQRNSYIKGKPVNILGLKAGVVLFDRHSLGLGGYSITNSTSHFSARLDKTINQKTDLKYLTAFYEYSFLDKRWWEIGIPVEIGGGYYKITSTDPTTNKSSPTKTGLVIPLGTALDVYFKPTRWFAINVMGGYRFVITNDARVNFNGWFYSFGGAVYMRQILQDLRYFNKKRIYKKELEIVNRLAD
ncbi:MAG: hypothetical protein ABI388_05780 [Bacteroidia bacterium]